MNNSVIGLDIASGGHMLFVPTRNNTLMLNGGFGLMMEKFGDTNGGQNRLPYN